MTPQLMLELYDLGRNTGMTHAEALGHAVRISDDPSKWTPEIVFTSAYIAIREEYSAQIAKTCAQNYVDGLQKLVDELG